MAPRGESANYTERQSDESDIQRIMVQQAEAAAVSEHDATNDTPAERRHMGHDVPMPDTYGLESPMVEREVPPPAYGEQYGRVRNEKDGFGTDARVADDGRVNIRIDQRSRRLSDLLFPALRHQQELENREETPPPAYLPSCFIGEGQLNPAPLNIVIQVVGSRGDVQPFVALGKVLKEKYHHRIRLATHPVFRDFVRENGLEFFSIGGDPAQLMAFMVKNPGLMPGFDTLRSGDVGKRRREVAEYLRGCWRSCYEAGEGLGPEASDDTIEDWTSQPDSPDLNNKPFVAHAIIANPPSFAHIHCAEKLGIPLHIMFTMPYSPTQAFPHPLANVQSSNADPHLTNYLTYALIDMLTWQGLGDLINRFRQKSLGLDPISLVWAPGMLQRLRIPHTYCWSPALIPKPKDWGRHISISGFFFLNLASNYTPPPDLQAFLDAGPTPIYIGFGSIVLDDPDAMTRLIFEAVKKTGQRALVSKGWGGFGADEIGIPEGVFMLGNVPHDWLFKHVSAVVHHGGAGTTAAGISAGRPTLVVPFFGDQPFWGAMVARAGAGPDPIPHKQLTADSLAEAIKVCLKPESQERAQELAAKIASENGSDNGAESFHQNLNLDGLRCNLAPCRAAVWRVRRTQVRLSAMAACTLANEGLLEFNDLKLYRPREYDTDEGPWDPITGGATAIVGTMSTMMMGFADFPVDTLKALRIHPDARSKSQEGTMNSEPSMKSETVRPSEENISSQSQTTRTSSSGETPMTSGLNTPGSSTPSNGRMNTGFSLQESLASLQSPNLTFNDGKSNMPSSMADALRGQLNNGSRPRSRSGSRPRSKVRAPSGENPIDTAMQTGKGIRKIVGAGLSSPMDFTMALTKGFHNAPKLYGDDTVRKQSQVTDFRSGAKAAAKEFGLGMYDGITGLVTQPMRGAAKEGPAGFIKGIGKGIAGIALKPGAAIFGIPGYTMKGIYKEMQARFGSSVQNYIIAARTAQGYDEWQASTPQEREEIVRRWKSLQKDLKKKRNPDEVVRDVLEEQRRKKQEYIDHLKADLQDKRASIGRGGGSRSRSSSSSRYAQRTESPAHHDPESAMLAMGSDVSGRTHAHTISRKELDSLEEAELQEAIKRSVYETSKGDADEDEAVERAVRASMADLQRERTRKAEDEQVRQAMEASRAEAEARGHPDVAHDEEMERVLARSLMEQRGQTSDRGESYAHPSSFGEASQRSTHGSGSCLPYDSGHLAGTTREDFEHQQGQGSGEKSQQEKDEERIVIEYVKKQSLLEAAHRSKAAAGSRKGNNNKGEASGS